MNGEESKLLKDIRADIIELKMAVMGSNKLKINGLIQKVDKNTIAVSELSFFILLCRNPVKSIIIFCIIVIIIASIFNLQDVINLAKSLLSHSL